MPALKSVAASQIKAPAAFVISGIDPYISYEQIEQAVVVEIKEDGPGRMTCRAAAEAGFLGNVLEFSMTQIFEQEVAHPRGGDKQVGEAVIIDVSE